MQDEAYNSTDASRAARFAEQRSELLGRVKAERDRYREALEQVCNTDDKYVYGLARHVLGGGSFESWIAELHSRDDHRVGDGDRYREALEKIANEDFRGNRPWSATVAYEALNGDSP